PLDPEALVITTFSKLFPDSFQGILPVHKHKVLVFLPTILSIPGCAIIHHIFQIWLNMGAQEAC
ncbi:hypothetical protein, partial [Streptococcus suis]|uniref:hypothetical protein n=1 Tax=Streptococcus suis TaxID=1307 RepID=UPI0037A2E994